MLRWVALAVASCSGLAVSASAVTLTPHNATRYVSSTAAPCLDVQDPDSCDPADGSVVSSSAFGPFDATADNPALPGAVVTTQHSNIQATGVQGSGSLTMRLQDTGFISGGTSELFLGFSLDEAALVSFTGDFAVSADVPFSPNLFADSYGNFFALLCREGCDPDEGLVYVDVRQPTWDGDVPDANASFAFEGVVPAGIYRLELRAVGGESAIHADSLSLDYSFALTVSPVAEPSGAALLVTSGLLVALAQVFDAALRSTPK